MDLGFTIAVVITGIVVVFVVLTILVMLCTSMGAFFSTENQAPQETIPSPVVTKTEVAPPSPAPTPVVEDGISNEVVAAISASIAVIMGEENATYRIASVQKAGQQTNITDKRATRTAWSNAGYVENTKPF